MASSLLLGASQAAAVYPEAATLRVQQPVLCLFLLHGADCRLESCQQGRRILDYMKLGKPQQQPSSGAAHLHQGVALDRRSGGEAHQAEVLLRCVSHLVVVCRHVLATKLQPAQTQSAQDQQYQARARLPAGA